MEIDIYIYIYVPCVYIYHTHVRKEILIAYKCSVLLVDTYFVVEFFLLIPQFVLSMVFGTLLSN